jgi:soluble lytic murein transglycosylase-like protein
MTKAMIVKMIIFYSQLYHVDQNIALAVARQESNYNPNIISETNDVGVFQLNVRSFPQYSINQLKDPKINIPEGIKYLAKMKKECKYNKDLEWLVCYNLGPERSKTLRYPALWPYTRKIAAIIERNEK